ncbi:CGNR zinc finger domain-containing protein [Kribbella sp. CA-253562]|uniref:CGNR zinc finger domain-containing protein n=1 Tax=Kribbella sp. CA-253562 TaxID=3239942 RepID=UPI003D943D7E
MTIRPTVTQLLDAGFGMGGEPLVALDLADTEILVTDPVTDLIRSDEQHAAWWQLQAGRLPEGPIPDVVATRRLRSAVREVLDAQLTDRRPLATAIEDLNAASAAAPQSVRLGADGHIETRYHPEYGGNAKLAAIARETIELLADPEQLTLLRRCANPQCSMLFLAEHKRRQWCVGSICGNRARVARHYDKTRRHA